MDSSHHAPLSSPKRNGEDHQRNVTEQTLQAPGKSSDTAERQGIEEQLQLHAAILRYVTDSVVVSDLHGNIMYWNEGASAVFGYTAEEMMGKTAALLYYDEFDVSRYERQVERFKAGQDYVGEWKGRRKDGNTVWVEARTTVLRDLRGTAIGIIGLAKDITEQKELEQRKDHFISMASHELKTPLTVLRVYTQLLLDMFEAEDRQDVMQHLSKMDDQITRLTNLVVDLLDISKMQAGQIEMAREAVDMESLAREVVENLQPTTGHRLLIEGEAQGTITGDREHLGQVLIILLNNAIKYSPRADIVLVRLNSSEETLTVAVRDYGIGIGEEHQGRIFERFYRALSKQDKTFPGMGIGLYIAHEIIQRHGGKMWVESVEGSGSTFYFSLPA